MQAHWTSLLDPPLKMTVLQFKYMEMLEMSAVFDCLTCQPSCDITFNILVGNTRIEMILCVTGLIILSFKVLP